jgi:hypothetical protein
MKGNPYWLGVLMLLLVFPCLSQNRIRPHTDLKGYVFEKDGTSPVEQATVYVRRLPDGEPLTSIPTDRTGMFEILDLEEGVYVLAVKTSLGNFNTRKVLGIRMLDDEYAKMYLALFPLSEEEDSGRLPAVLPNPVGQVIVLAGNSAVVIGISEIDDEPREAGPFRIRRQR